MRSRQSNCLVLRGEKGKWRPGMTTVSQTRSAAGTGYADSRAKQRGAAQSRTFAWAYTQRRLTRAL
jgi:hypothetical protein